MDRELKRKAWRRLHMEQPFSMSYGGPSGGLAHLYASLKLYKSAGYTEAGGEMGRIARRASIACMLIERRVLITRDEVISYVMGEGG